MTGASSPFHDSHSSLQTLDLLVLGSGVAGLTAAVHGATKFGSKVGVLTKAELHQAATRWAQGGVAAVLAGDEDSTDMHLADTLAAGVGLCNADAVRIMVDEGPGRVHDLIALGAVFDTDAQGALLLAREGGHSRPRIVHAGGAATGAEIERALVDAVRATAAVVLEGWYAIDLLVEDGCCAGVLAFDERGVRHVVRAHHTLLATGGAGQLYSVTTNPTQATGDGVAMALRSGVAVSDIEFMQFHPTALHHPAMPRPLLSEALRGHGAILRDLEGDRFIDELATRDQVSRAMTVRMAEQHAEHLWLDVTSLDQFDKRFPTLASSLHAVGLNPKVDWLPIAPAAHYLAGGVMTDLDGATSLPKLWACGEVACTGVHGANRLASNSLLEGMVFAPRVIEAIDRGKDGPDRSGVMGDVEASAVEVHSVAIRSSDEGAEASKLRAQLQQVMTRGAGVVRSESSLMEAASVIKAPCGVSTPEDAEAWNLVTVAAALVGSALARTESRGNHWRSDYPEIDLQQAHRLVHGSRIGSQADNS